jgi:hypothetical protein
MKRAGISEKLKEKVRRTARFRCGYCLFLQKYLPGVLRIDHILPIAKGGTNEEENLWLLCETCNRAKSGKTEVFDSVTNTTVPIFNPRTQNWNEHFEWSEDKTRITGKTPTGRGTVAELDLNKERLVKVRHEWVLAGWHPPQD